VSGRDYYSNIVKPNYFAYTYPHPLTGKTASIAVTSLHNAIGEPSVVDTIYGSGFLTTKGNGYVKVGSDSVATTSSWADTKIVFTVPALSVGTHKIFVVNNNFQVDSSKTYRVFLKITRITIVR
jgi:hypothetical protein